jgi:hypothetical protein
MNKKGVELSMNLIIVAAIALLVLVIIAILVLRGGTNIAEGTACTAKPGGQCVAADQDCGTGQIVLPGGGCPAQTPKCCINSPV